MRLLHGPREWPSPLLSRAGRLDPDAGLVAAERAGAWRAWKRMVRVSPEAVIRIVADSGLRGRGGAGYPAGDKWRLCASQPESVRYVVANGFEADPGALLDRTLMESDPNAVVEGLALAAYAVGATHAYLAVKSSYTLAIRRLRAVIAAAEEAGYLGSNALGTGFDLQVHVRELDGAFVLGEETVLLRALENKRAMPDQRPPYPAVAGLWGKPTVVNNVETLAAVPAIVVEGTEPAGAAGTAAAASTTLFQLSGAVARPGVIEAPLGVTLGELLDVAGGMPGGPMKAVLVGGPSGGFLPATMAADARLSWGSLRRAGAIMGSGTVLVADERACIVDLATLMSRFMNEEACGKTIPCRIGTRRLTEIGERFTTGRARPTDPKLLIDLASDVKDSALCGHEHTAPNPLLTGMRYFAEEFEDHIVRSSCPAGVCRPLQLTAAAIQ